MAILQKFCQGAYALMPAWLVVATFALHFRPEFVALTALSVAFVVSFLPSDEAPPARRHAAGLRMAAVVLYLAAAVLLGRELLSERERIPLLTPLSPWLAVAGTVVVAATLALAARTLGPIVAAIVCLLVAYALLGHLLGGALGHGTIGLPHFLDLSLFTTDGLLGAPLGVVVGTVVHFLVFAAVLERTGATAVFCELAERVCGGSRGGAAKVSAISSGLFGTISGSTSADVVATGPMTIAAMRAAGYPSSKAAAIEVAASTGGSFLPPVMGTAGFILAEYTGTPYRDVLVAALLPGLLYYATLLLALDLDARRAGYSRTERGPVGAPDVRRYIQLAVPAGVLVTVLTSGYPPAYAAAAGTVGALLCSVMRPEGVLGPGELLRSLEDTGRRLNPVIAACASAGLIIGCITMTGLSGKVAGLLVWSTGGLFWPTLAAAACMCLVFGMGMPTTSAYILGAMLLAPAMTDIGVPLLAAHLFVLYFAVLSAMTPPVAVACFAVVAISGGHPYRIGIEAMRFAVAAFVLPFAFVAFPGLLLEGDAASVAAALARTSGALLAAVLAIEGTCFRALRVPERLAAAACALLFLTPGAAGAYAGMAVLGGLAGSQVLSRAKQARRRGGRQG